MLAAASWACPRYDLRFYAMSTEFLLSLERLPSHEEITGFLRKRPASLANLAAKHLGMTAGPANGPAASYRESGGPAHMPGKQKQAPGGGGGKLRSEISVSGGGSISGASVGSFGSVGGHGAGGGQGGPKLSAFEAALQAAATAVAAPANEPAAGAANNGPGGSTGGVASGPGKGEGEKSGEGGPVVWKPPSWLGNRGLKQLAQLSDSGVDPPLLLRARLAPPSVNLLKQELRLAAEKVEKVGVSGT